MVTIVTQDIANSVVRDDPAMFVGEVRGQDLVQDGALPQLRIAAITFVDGARNQCHRHDTEQVLIVTHGEGIIADADGERTIRVGDVVSVQPGEWHWHGAAPGQSMTHITILLPGGREIDATRCP